MSDYLNWKDKEQGEHADKWLVFPHNVGPRMSIDETSLSDGELYTIVSNKDAKGKRGQGENPVFRITKKYVPLNR